MAQPPPHIEKAAKRAATSVAQLLIEMLMSNQRGEVIVEVGYGDLTPLKRVEDRRKTIKVARGEVTEIAYTTK